MRNSHVVPTLIVCLVFKALVWASTSTCAMGIKMNKQPHVRVYRNSKLNASASGEEAQHDNIL